MSGRGGALGDALLPDELLPVLRERAAEHDRDATLPQRDLDELRARGYLGLLVPRDLGGSGADLLTAGRLQRRLAGAAPATALALNMHLVVTGAALHAHRLGVTSVEPLLREAAEGRLHAFGISEAGNEAMLYDAATRADPDGEGGYRLTGTKIFTTLAPVWDRLVVHGRVDEDGTPPGLVVGVLTGREGVRTREDWDAHGMRATQSRTTLLDGAPLPADRVLTRTPVGPHGDPFVTGVFGVFELLLASVYTGIAERAVVLGGELARGRRTGPDGTPRSDHPDVRRRLAAAAIGLDGAVLQTEAVLAHLDALGTGLTGPGTVDHGEQWFLRFSGVKHRVTEAAVAAVDQVVRASGGAQYARRGELERLSRDVRAGLHHPSGEDAVHASFARAVLGEIGAEDADRA